MDKICSVQLCLGILTLFSIMVSIPSAHGKPFILQGKLKLTNPQDILLALLLNQNLGWRRPLEKLKEQLLAGEGSEVAYAEAGLLPSHPDKRGGFGLLEQF
uniref:Uncharacterized protein n=1 Tax=Pelusios castaneus TaxID=367368 RepID=A0A8C8SJA4_9SAUR